jgi:hypothetical protein
VYPWFVGGVCLVCSVFLIFFLFCVVLCCLACLQLVPGVLNVPVEFDTAGESEAIRALLAGKARVNKQIYLLFCRSLQK